MTFEIGFLFAVLAAMVYLFLTEKLPVDLTAFLGLVVLVFAGYVDPSDAFVGFSSPAVITMLAIFIVSAALLETGVADTIGSWIHRWVGSREIPLIITLMLVAGVMSAFMNNIAATAVLMPAVASLGSAAGIGPGRLFMPLSFGAILGGTTTLVGTPPNLLAGDVLAQQGLRPFGLFEFAPFGLVILGLGTVFMCTIGRRLLPAGGTPTVKGDGDELEQVYAIENRLFKLRIPRGSTLDGASIADTRVGNTLGVQIVSIRRGGRRMISPGGDVVLQGEDELLVQGNRESLQRLLRVRDLEVADAPSADAFDLPESGVLALRLAVPETAEFAGQSLREMEFRERYGIVVVQIERDGATLRDHLGSATLAPRDRVIGIGLESRLDEVSAAFEVEETGEAVLEALDDSVFVLDLTGDSALVGTTLAESRMGELTGLSVIGVVRAGEGWLNVAPALELRAHDRLLVVGDRARITGLVAVGDVELEEQASRREMESEQVRIVEAAVAPRSALEGKTPIEVDFRERYGLQILSVWRAGERIYDDLGDLALKVGDALLLLGDHDEADALAGDRDLILLTQGAERPRRRSKAPFALGALALMVGLVMSGLQPIQMAAFTAASLVVLSGALSMREAYQAIEWRAIFLVAAVLPAGAAMETSGAAAMLANSVTDVAGPYGPYAVLASLVLLSSLLSQGLDGAPAVVLLSPVVIETAQKLDLSPYPLMMGVALAASAAFMTPFSHKANLLVMGIGGYRSRDFLRVGTPLTIVLLAVIVFMVPLIMPF